MKLSLENYVVTGVIAFIRAGYKRALASIYPREVCIAPKIQHDENIYATSDFNALGAYDSS